MVLKLTGAEDTGVSHLSNHLEVYLGWKLPALRRLSINHQWLFPDLAEFQFVSRLCLKSVLWLPGKDGLLISGQGFNSLVTSSGQSSSWQLPGSSTIRLKL
ncbi:hypothetical protein GOODEAATRI_029079 [Goodea atripinnis]|uniref:Uncharacterized protein n=1 Tax=Goodea atripinnis TaxID=208336 RepID=A0ABV0P0J8_9TELE